MALKPKILTTEVDLLMDLVKRSKEIPLSEAAKQLKLPVKTVEEWSTFLEEEKQLSIKYKLTTPYLVYIERPEEEAKAEAKSLAEQAEPKLDIKEMLKEAESILSSSGSHLRTGEFGLARHSMSRLLERLRELYDQVSRLSDKADAKRDEFEVELAEIRDQGKKAKHHLQKGNFDIASELYLKIHSSIEKLLLEIKQMYEESAPKERGRQDIAALFEKAYSLIKEGNVEEAKIVYEKIRGYYSGLSADFFEKRTEVERDLMKLNKDLSLNIDVLSEKKMREASARIKLLLSNAKQEIKQRNFDLAEKVYAQIKAVFSSLPAGFQNQKRELEKEVIRFYEELAIKRQEVLLRQFRAKAKEIKSDIASIRTVMSSNVFAATKVYNEIRQKYSDLPSGFMKEKLGVQSEILEVYKDLSERYSEALAAKNKQKTAEVISVLDEVKKHIAAGSLALAEKSYHHAKALYIELPEGFLIQKTDIQNKMLQVYEELLMKSTGLYASDFFAKIGEIDKLIGEALNYLKNRQYELAQQVYFEIMHEYNTLPVGFAPQKRELRNRLLNIYRDITLHVDQPFLDTTSSDTAQKYNDILKTLVNFHHNVGKQSFAALETDYNHVKQLFNDLPVGFVNEKMVLREEIMRAYQELQLYKKICEMETLLRAGRVDELRKLVEETRTMAGALRARCPEDVLLFDYAEKKAEYYTEHVEAPKEKPRQQAKESSSPKEQLALPVPLKEGKPEENHLTTQHLSAGHGLDSKMAELDEKINNAFGLSASKKETSSEEIDTLKYKIEQLKKVAAPKVSLPNKN